MFYMKGGIAVGNESLRTNDSVDEILTEYNEHIEVDELDEPEYFIYYSTCPDCGVKIGIENDGGNGFCVNYASKH